MLCWMFYCELLVALVSLLFLLPIYYALTCAKMMYNLSIHPSILLYLEVMVGYWNWKFKINILKIRMYWPYIWLHFICSMCRYSLKIIYLSSQILVHKHLSIFQILNTISKHCFQNQKSFELKWKKCKIHLQIKENQC